LQINQALEMLKCLHSIDQGEVVVARPKGLVITAWTFLLLASLLPKIILQEIFKVQVSADLGAIIAGSVLLIGLILTLIWDTVRGLRPFFIVGLVLVGVEWFVFTKVDQLPLYQKLLNNPSFSVNMLAEQSLRLLVTLTIIAVLLILKKHASAFFLVKGDTAAPVESVKLLGIKQGERWNKLGPLFALILSSGTLAFLILAGHPSPDLVVRVLPFLPAILIAAALNAFNEEMTYKASFLSVLEDVVSKHQSLWLMAVYFGLGHFYGIPYGIIGVIMAGFLGWFLGKSMLETRGLWWAWFIHFWQDVLIFSFLAIGSVTPGG